MGKIYIAGALTSSIIESKELNEKLMRELCYYQEGIAVYYEDINSDL